MPRLRTHRATAKRFKITGSGKLRRRKGRRSNLRHTKAKSVQRGFDKYEKLECVDEKGVRHRLGLKRPGWPAL
jgi:large subunit ribosomal protein L35